MPAIDPAAPSIEQTLRDSERRFRAFVVASSDIVYRMSPDWSEMRELDGRGVLIDTLEPTRQWMERYVHADDRLRVRAAVDAAIRDRAMFELEHRVVGPGSHRPWVLSRAVPILNEDGGIAEWLGSARDVTARREAQERQAFLLELGDRQRSAANAQTAMTVAAEMIARRLEVSVAQFCLLEADGDAFHVAAGYSNGRLPGMQRPGRLSDHGASRGPGFRAGTAIFADDRAEPLMANGHGSRCSGVRSGSTVPLLRDGRLVALLSTADPDPRPWTDLEKSLQHEVAERTWSVVERFHAEAALRDSEMRLRLIVENAADFAIFTTDPDGIVVDWRRGAEAVFGYAGETITGRSCDILYVPEDRARGAPARERAEAAEQGKAGNLRWHLRSDGSLVFIDGVAKAMHDQAGRLIGFLKIGHDVTERQTGDDRQKLLLAELQHRVRNILAMVRSVVRQSSGAHDDVEDYVAHLVGRLDAMARTQAILTRNAGGQVNLEHLVRDELHSQRADETRITIGGPEVGLSPKAAEVLTLALHELATNSVKYGALSDPDGKLSVTWGEAPLEGQAWLQLTWEESCKQVVPRPITAGFGTELIEERVPYELCGEARLHVTGGGVRAEIAFPLTEGMSVFETGPAGRWPA